MTIRVVPSALTTCSSCIRVFSLDCFLIIHIKCKLLDWVELQDSWKSVRGILDYFAENQYEYMGVARPGQWNDPDVVRFKSETLWLRLTV